jgi:2-polyprenyl-6-methoxyphenol hydroxylase-like FAD-dependent oxidoreductase
MLSAIADAHALDVLLQLLDSSGAAQVGIPTVVLERDADLRLEGSAIALWSNAFRALAALGVAQPLLDNHPPLTRRALREASPGVGCVLWRHAA